MFTGDNVFLSGTEALLLAPDFGLLRLGWGTGTFQALAIQALEAFFAKLCLCRICSSTCDL